MIQNDTFHHNDDNNHNKRPEPDYQIRLAYIFTQLHKPNSTKQALKDLYQFQLDHANISIDSHLNQCTNAFQGYIKRGLSQLAEQNKTNRIY